MRVEAGSRGFTLMELLIAVAMVAILAAIAYPSYLDSVRESRRAEGKTLLLRAVNRQERFFSTSSPNSYGDSMEDLGWTDADGKNENNSVASAEGWYNVSVVSGDASTFTLRAVAQNDQTNDECVRLEVNQLGQRRAFDAAAGGNNISDECW